MIHARRKLGYLVWFRNAAALYNYFYQYTVAVSVLFKNPQVCDEISSPAPEDSVFEKVRGPRWGADAPSVFDGMSGFEEHSA